MHGVKRGLLHAKSPASTASRFHQVDLPMRAAMPDKRAAVMQQVSDWLEKLGLGQYAQRFAENDIEPRS
jgi:SAM domain (Sterile alpha motif)